MVEKAKLAILEKHPEVRDQWKAAPSTRDEILPGEKCDCCGFLDVRVVCLECSRHLCRDCKNDGHICSPRRRFELMEANAAYWPHHRYDSGHACREQWVPPGGICALCGRKRPS